MSLLSHRLGAVTRWPFRIVEGDARGPRGVSAVRAATAALALCAALSAGCSCSGEHAGTRAVRALPGDVRADSALGLAAPASRWRADAARGAAPTQVRIAPEPALPPPPEPEPGAPGGAGAAPEGLQADDALRPPIPRGQAAAPPGGAPAGAVELDLRVDESGRVTDALPAGAAADSATVRAALEAARSLRYFPATRAGRPVAVWCRQRFEVRAR